ncbi:hypothetical protein [Lelliottia nimipressuralis]|uniref:Uncharacterized protein n=1 Tax=Lelliottia nimipressuralis TaxID=69220 RepID=A0ABY3NWL5_9ENTR|nr:hypothetical protein [Lelliottia nimipressuralis]RXJ09138.1 hypothetical protein ETG88_21800 [Lelliottia nimipressuralis]TYT28078.1 hypothetical protein FZO59_22120 [Lelliottia nimipressuralis]
MRLGSNQRIVSLVLLFIISVSIFIPIQKAYSNPLLVARAVMPAVVGRVIGARAMKAAVAAGGANEAVYLTLVKNTTSAISKATISKSSNIASSGFFRSASGALTWGGVGYTAGTLTADYFSSSGGYMVATSGKPIGDGKYEVTFGDATFVVDYEPSEDNPVVLLPGKFNTDSHETVAELQPGHKWYMFPYGTKGEAGYIVGTISGVAMGYLETRRDAGGFTCRAPDKVSCTYTIEIREVTDNGTSASVKYSYTGTYTDSNGKEQSFTNAPIIGIVPNYNKDFNPDEEILYGEPKIATDEDGFSAMDALKDVPMDLDQLASMINNMLMDAAAQPDYEGIPVSSSDPVTSGEIKANYPNHGKLNDFDYMYPSQNAPNADINIEAPKYNGDNNSGNESELPSFEYPDVDTPELEDAPTANEILRPIKELFPEYRDMNISGKSKASYTCPIAEFNVFDTDYALDQHCVFLEQYRPWIQLISTLMWSLFALRILLSA